MEQAFPLRQDNNVALLLQAELYDVMAVSELRVEKGQQPAIAFTGQLLRAPEAALETLVKRFRTHGYTPLIRREQGQDVVVAIEGVFGPTRSRPWINVVLLLATVLTTTLAGALLAGANPLRDPLSILSGVSFAFTLLLILGMHELGHYFMGRWHGVAVTLPYFIPVPLGLGTFGAFIRMKSPIQDRRALFDVGFAGPLVGFVVALPLLILGILLSPVVRVGSGSLGLGSSLLIEFLTNLLKPHGPGYALMLHPVAIAAYFGILITGFNLLPAGQLDGGHISYAIFGPAARPLAIVSVVALLLMGVTLWSGWLIWAFLIVLLGLRHPAPLNDVTPLDPARKLIALGAVVLFVLTFVPNPF